MFLLSSKQFNKEGDNTTFVFGTLSEYVKMVLVVSIQTQLKGDQTDIPVITAESKSESKDTKNNCRMKGGWSKRKKCIATIPIHLSPAW